MLCKRCTLSLLLFIFPVISLASSKDAKLNEVPINLYLNINYGQGIGETDRSRFQRFVFKQVLTKHKYNLNFLSFRDFLKIKSKDKKKVFANIVVGIENKQLSIKVLTYGQSDKKGKQYHSVFNEEELLSAGVEYVTKILGQF